MVDVNTTSRIIVNIGGGAATIYCSNDVIRSVRDHLVRVDQKMFAKKGERDKLVAGLLAEVKKRPEHFMKSSRLLLEAQLGPEDSTPQRLYGY